MPKPSKNAASVVVRGAKSALPEASKTPPEGSKMPPNGSENGSQAGLRVEYRPIEALNPFARNSRTHSNEQVAQIAASIREFGFTNPILTDENEGIMAGHGCLLAAKELGLAKAGQDDPADPLLGSCGACASSIQDARYTSTGIRHFPYGRFSFLVINS